MGSVTWLTCPRDDTCRLVTVTARMTRIPRQATLTFLRRTKSGRVCGLAAVSASCPATQEMLPTTCSRDAPRHLLPTTCSPPLAPGAKTREIYRNTSKKLGVPRLPHYSQGCTQATQTAGNVLLQLVWRKLDNERQLLVK